MYAQDSIDMLKQSGIDFEKFEKYGIDVHHFGELMMVSGLVLNDDVKWLSFHSTYDFGYLVKTLTCKDLPDTETAFLEILQMYFPGIYDIKVSPGLASFIVINLSYFWCHAVHNDCRGRNVWWLKWTC